MNVWDTVWYVRETKCIMKLIDARKIQIRLRTRGNSRIRKTLTNEEFAHQNANARFIKSLRTWNTKRRVTWSKQIRFGKFLIRAISKTRVGCVGKDGFMKYQDMQNPCSKTKLTQHTNMKINVCDTWVFLMISWALSLPTHHNPLPIHVCLSDWVHELRNAKSPLELLLDTIRHLERLNSSTRAHGFPNLVLTSKPIRVCLWNLSAHARVNGRSNSSTYEPVILEMKR